ncbi:MAG: J domain-containing protein [Thermodesulfobacteriota bacterium]
MLKNYITLGLPENADDDMIRQRYLFLIQKYTPEKYPEIFNKLTKAYEALNTEEKRISDKLFGVYNSHLNFEDEIYALVYGKNYYSENKILLKDLVKKAKKGVNHF